jgi:hypothetical protein
VLPQGSDGFRIAIVDREATARAHAAAESQNVGGGSTESMQRQPVGKAIGHRLDILRKGFMPPSVVAAPKHDASAHHLKVETPATRCAVVEDQAGMTTGQFIEKMVEAVDVADLTQADLVRLFIRVPEISWIEIEILPVKIEARAGDLF